MSIEELMSKHVSVRCRNDGNYVEHTNLSIEFAIDKLYEAAGTKDEDYLHSLAINDTVVCNIESMIQELRQQINN